MTIQKLYRNRLVVCGVLAAIAVGIGIAGLVSDRIYFWPASMMAAAALIGFHLAWTSYRFDRGLSGPPEWRELVRDAKAWTDGGQSPDCTPTQAPSDGSGTPDRP